MSVSPKVVAVVVTWNRRDLLSESLAAVEGQTLAPVSVVVVDTVDVLVPVDGHDPVDGDTLDRFGSSIGSPTVALVEVSTSVPSTAAVTVVERHEVVPVAPPGVALISAVPPPADHSGPGAG